MVTRKPVVRVQDLCLEFPAQGRKAESVEVLSDFSLTVGEGEIYALVGPSGCGKSTLLSVLAGLAEPSSGSVFLPSDEGQNQGGQQTCITPLMMFQQPFLFPWMRVKSIVSYGPRIRKEPKESIEQRTDELLAATGLNGFGDHYPYQLSGGMKQRVALARSLINQPKVLLMDEPFGAIDAQTRLEMQQLLLNIWDSFRPSIIFVTHDVEEALYLGHRVGVCKPRPTNIIQEFEVPYEHPRELDLIATPEFVDMRRDILHQLRGD